ncbi:MAG: caspase family protein [Rhizomicrobium sp.]
MRYWLLPLCVLLGLTPAAAAPPPVRHAILVGVQDYGSLPGVSLFDGPRNSVLLWHDYLKAHGFGDIAVLAEGLDAGDVKWAKADPRVAPPTRANIQRAFGDLEKRLEKTGGKDTVLIVLAGHGSQQRAAKGDPPKPGNLDEVFLPMDAGPRPAGDPEGPFANALVDHDIAPHLKAIARHAGFIWLVFDSCHSDTMTYDALLLHRGPVTSAGMHNLDYATRTPARPLIPPQAPPPAFGPSPRDKDWPKNYVAFFASSADQTTPLIVADPGPAAARIGGDPARFTAFSYFILDALRKNPSMRFDAVIASVMANYRISYPSDSYAPKVEGGARLQLPVSTVIGTR